MFKTFEILNKKVSDRFNGTNARSKTIARNVALSFGVKVGSILIGLILVPMTINYINPMQYGIWLTISSIVTWMSFFDIGMGNGLRNKLAIALAHDNYIDAKKYISTTYASIAIIAVLLFLMFSVINPYINWREFLNIPVSVSDDIQIVMLIVFGTFCIQFIVQLINTVLSSIHEPATAGLISFIGQFCLLLAIFVLKHLIPGSLRILVTVLTIVPIIVLIVSSLFIYRGKLKHIGPSIKFVDFNYSKSILNTGGAFFFVQIGALVLFQTNNIIITKVIGPEAVTDFNVAYKLFSVITMVFTIVITPYWSAFTDAFAKGDFEWMKKSIKAMRKMWLGLSFSVILLLTASPWIFRIWLGTEVKISFQLSVAMAAYIIVYMWQTLHVYFLNGVGKIRLQLILVLISALFNIPLSIFLGNLWGTSGIISANTLTFIVLGAVFSIQVKKILNKTDSGLWGV